MKVAESDSALQTAIAEAKAACDRLAGGDVTIKPADLTAADAAVENAGIVAQAIRNGYEQLTEDVCQARGHRAVEPILTIDSG